MLESAINLEIRKRVNIVPIGSPAAIARQMAARFKERRQAECIALMDGDQANKVRVHCDAFLKALESTFDTAQAEAWLVKRLAFLPGETWPERWLITCTKDGDLKKLAGFFQVPEHELLSCLERAEIAKKHTEIFEIASELSLDCDYVQSVMARYAIEEKAPEFEGILTLIARLLG